MSLTSAPESQDKREMLPSHHCIDKKDGDHVFTHDDVEAGHMIQCRVHPERWMGPGKECIACKAIRQSEERKEKEGAKKIKKNRETEAKVPSKANGWDWPEPQPKPKDRRNKVASTKRKGGNANRFTVQ